MSARPMPMGPGGQALGFDYLARKAHNPGRQKKQRAFYKDARVIRDFKKLQRSDADVAGSSCDFTKPSKRTRAEAETVPAAVGPAEKPRKKRKKLDPFRKVRDARAAAAEERERDVAASEAQKAAAAKARKEKTKRVQKKGGKRLKSDITDILAKLDKGRSKS